VVAIIGLLEVIPASAGICSMNLLIEGVVQNVLNTVSFLSDFAVFRFGGCYSMLCRYTKIYTIKQG